MRALSSTCGSRGGVGSTVGLAAQRGALGAEARACAPPDRAATAERDVPAAAGVAPNEVWR
jgi:hypothetical protein